MTRPKRFANVFDALADTPGQAANMQARAELMMNIADMVEAGGWTQAEAATRCGVTQPRMNDLLRGRASKFSLDALVNMATVIGLRVRIEVEPLKHAKKRVISDAKGKFTTATVT